MNQYNSLFSISPIDGRYSKVTNSLSNYFSEYALIKYRVFVEIEYFIAFAEQCAIKLDVHTIDSLRNINKNFGEQDALKVKEIEKITNHDVKAVEYFLRDKFDEIGLSQYKEFIHFGLTSQDINNTAVPLSIKEFNENILYTKLPLLITQIKEKADQWMDIPMLAHTHGQPASPTLLGKEFMVFYERLFMQYSTIRLIPDSAKFGGATGNFNAHAVAYPEIDWREFANNFVNNTLGLSRSQTTTQIEHYDFMAAYFDNLKRINTILIDLCRDLWTYISMGYFKQKIVKGEVGSSAMPHKVNPIDFENAEGNLGFANAIFEHLAAKLPISRLQRDLTDSTVSRNIGVPLAHTIIAIESLLKGLNKIIVNPDSINRDLDNNWVVVSEAIQTVLRKLNYPDPYNALKELTRTNSKIDQQSLADFIDTLNIDDKTKAQLKQITPFNYTGIKPTFY